MTTEKTALQTLARSVSDRFVKQTRSDGKEFWSLRADSPDWMMQLCHHAHGDIMPDDFRYEFIWHALLELESNEDPDEIILEADVYTSHLTEWLASNINRPAYCDEAMEDYGNVGGVLQLITWGQIREREEVLSLVRSFLEQKIKDDAE